MAAGADLRGGVAVVTGASSGIGRETAARLGHEPLSHLVLVARREERLRDLAAQIGPRASWVAVDLTAHDAPSRVRAHLESLASDGPARLKLLVNNAGTSWRARFAEGGWDNARRTMELNFDAQLRLTHELLPLLRASAPSAVVNVGSVAARVSRPGTGAYSASKAALGAWSDALYAEEKANGVHVGLVLPGFVATEGFPAAELTGRAATRWLVTNPQRAAQAIVDAGAGGRAECFVPRAWAITAVLRVLAPGLVRRVTAGARGSAFTTRTGADAREGGGAGHSSQAEV